MGEWARRENGRNFRDLISLSQSTKLKKGNIWFVSWWDPDTDSNILSPDPLLKLKHECQTCNRGDKIDLCQEA